MKEDTGSGAQVRLDGCQALRAPPAVYYRDVEGPSVVKGYFDIEFLYGQKQRPEVEFYLGADLYKPVEVMLYGYEGPGGAADPPEPYSRTLLSLQASMILLQ